MLLGIWRSVIHQLWEIGPFKLTYPNNVEVFQLAFEFNHGRSETDLVIANNLGPARQHPFRTTAIVSCVQLRIASCVPKPELDSRGLRVDSPMVTESPGRLSQNRSAGESDAISECVAISLDIRHHGAHLSINVNDPTGTEWLQSQLRIASRILSLPDPFGQRAWRRSSLLRFPSMIVVPDHQ